MSEKLQWALGPTTGNKMVDFFARQLAIDLFVNPYGVRFLAVVMLAKAVVQPKAPDAQECILGAFEAVFAAQGEVELDFAGVDPVCGEAVLLFQPSDGTRLSLALTVSHLLTGGRWRSIQALAALLATSGAWEHTRARGFHTTLTRTAFTGRALLRHFYDSRYLALLMLEHLFVDCVPAPALAGGAWAQLVCQLATFFAQQRDTDMAQFLERHAHDLPGLAQGLRERAAEKKQDMLKFSRIMLPLWDKHERTRSLY